MSGLGLKKPGTAGTRDITDRTAEVITRQLLPVQERSILVLNALYINQTANGHHGIKTPLKVGRCHRRETDHAAIKRRAMPMKRR
jgi:hypothetical protein